MRRALLLVTLVSCGGTRSADPSVESEAASVCTAWSPAWRQASGANPWWVEYTIAGGTVQSAWLEVGNRRVNLTLQWGKWGGSTPRTDAGTLVTLHAVDSAGQAAQTFPFGYLVTTQPSTDDVCAAPEVDAGSTCEPGWDPLWQQANANSWWVEYTIGRGAVTSARLQVIDGGVANLSLQWGKWVGSPPKGIPSGASVVLHATDDAGHSAHTVPFGYLTTTQPLTEQCGVSAPPPPQCPGLDAGMVSVVMDDGWASQYTIARAPMLARGMKSTLHLITDRVGAGWTGYLTMAQAQALVADGNEIASHTVNHQNLTQMTEAQVDAQLRVSKEWLQSNLGVTATDFASPFGAYDETVVTVSQRYYQTHGTVQTGLNFRGDDLYRLRRHTIYSTTTPAQIHTWVQQAQSSRGWLILLFHDFTTGTATPSDMYQYRSSDFEAVLDDLAASGLDVVTVAQGAARLRCP